MRLLDSLFRQSRGKQRARELNQFHEHHYADLVRRIASLLKAPRETTGNPVPQGLDTILDRAANEGLMRIARQSITEELNTLIANMREAIQLDPKEKQQYLNLALLVASKIAVRLDQYMKELGKEEISLIELPKNAREEIKQLKKEGYECLQEYQKRRGVITPEQQEALTGVLGEK